MTQFLNDPVVNIVLFLLCAAIAVGSLLSSMKSGGSTYGMLFALIFAGLAAYFAPGAFALMNETGFE